MRIGEADQLGFEARGPRAELCVRNRERAELFDERRAGNDVAGGEQALARDDQQLGATLGFERGEHG